MKRVLVTGANGFVGSSLCERLQTSGYEVFAAVRRLVPERGGMKFVEGDLAQLASSGGVLDGVEVLVHLAARVHVMSDESPDPLAEFRKVNVAATASLARAAAAHGVKRLIYLSSIKVNGEQTDGRPYREQDVPNPQDPYGRSKMEAEQMLMQVAAETGMQVVILRPPLIYGPGVKANFLRLMGWVARGVPLPLAAVHNRRSMIYLGNLVDAIVTCVDHPAVVGKTYLLSDGEDVSTPLLIQRIAHAFGKSARIFPLPEPLLQLLGGLAGKRAEVDRLLGSLQVDSSRFRGDTGWAPPFTIEQGIAQTAAWYQRVLDR